MRVTVSIDSDAPTRLFLKRNEASMEDNFRCEKLGLVQLAAANVIRVPIPLAVGCVDGQAWLVTDWIDQAEMPSDFFGVFGRQLAQLHRATLGREIGWPRDNYLGAAPQQNSPAPTWHDFVAERRLGFQLRWAVDQRLADSRLSSDVQAIINRLPDLLVGRDPQTSLLHGDLWRGNYLCDETGNPVIIDPAVYRGCREAEFGMIRLFGSCPASFEQAYDQAFPLPDGWQRRVSVYVLYHLLNHLNLFGRGYLSQCHQVAAEVLQSST
tara:strand:- start:94142 stop:94942 length:801 start_codon:yes stop_codon:yes gene_type:complete